MHGGSENEQGGLNLRSWSSQTNGNRCDNCGKCEDVASGSSCEVEGQYHFFRELAPRNTKQPPQRAYGKSLRDPSLHKGNSLLTQLPTLLTHYFFWTRVTSVYSCSDISQYLPIPTIKDTNELLVNVNKSVRIERVRGCWPLDLVPLEQSRPLSYRAAVGSWFSMAPPLIDFFRPPCPSLGCIFQCVLPFSIMWTGCSLHVNSMTKG